jgi:hypothetical protein
MKTTALGLLIPELTDPPNGPEQIGGNAEKGDALHQSGGVAGHISQVSAVTTSSNSAASFSTPLRFTLKRILAGQVMELFFYGEGLTNVSSEGNLTLGGKLIVKVPSEAFPGTPMERTMAQIRGQGIPANTWVGFAPDVRSPSDGEAELDWNNGSTNEAGARPTNAGVLRYVAAAEQKNAVVELLGQTSGGVFSVRKFFMAARVWG